MDFEMYKTLQTEKYRSCESGSPRWSEGQSRFINQMLMSCATSMRILDVACGDGVGLKVFKELGFTSVVGVEFCHEKYELAKQHGFPVVKADMHELPFPDATFDIVYSSHTLEHALDPVRVLAEFRRVLVPSGQLVLVVPYPDGGPDDAHCAKHVLGTAVADDDAATFLRFLWNNGFQVSTKQYDGFRENEIWLKLHKRPQLPCSLRGSMTPQELIYLCEQTAVSLDAEFAEFDFSVQPLFKQWMIEVRYYRMMAEYTKIAGVRHALDLGCGAGLSALALAKHAKQVTTVDWNFDAVFDASIFTRRPINKWMVTGAEKPSSFDFSPYDMIFVDVAPHDGTYERDLHQKLLETWTGFAFYDDINFPGLAALWYDITVPKATADWHHSGFGVVQYGYKGA